MKMKTAMIVLGLLVVLGCATLAFAGNVRWRCINCNAHHTTDGSMPGPAGCPNSPNKTHIWVRN